jgi:hypothetical protein
MTLTFAEEAEMAMAEAVVEEVLSLLPTTRYKREILN